MPFRHVQEVRAQFSIVTNRGEFPALLYHHHQVVRVPLIAQLPCSDEVLVATKRGALNLLLSSFWMPEP